MKVYLLRFVWPDTQEIIGCYSTQEKAESEMPKPEFLGKNDAASGIGHWAIEELEVQ
jgi:hypothetical protein